MSCQLKINTLHPYINYNSEFFGLSGKSHITVQQDFHRIIMRANLANILSDQITRKGIKEINQARKRTYKINRTQAYRKVKDLIKGMTQEFDQICKKIQNYAMALIKQVERHRPNRSNPRIKRYAGKPANFMCYKP